MGIQANTDMFPNTFFTHVACFTHGSAPLLLACSVHSGPRKDIFRRWLDLGDEGSSLLILRKSNGSATGRARGRATPRVIALLSPLPSPDSAKSSQEDRPPVFHSRYHRY